MLKAILILVACFIALACAQCGQWKTSYECQLASSDTACCVWCKTNGQPAEQGSCINGFVANVNQQAGTAGAPDVHQGYSYPCGYEACTGGFEGRCSETANCPGSTPDVSGTWFYPPECFQIGGQFNITSSNGGAGVVIGPTGNQPQRIASYTGAVDTSGQVVLTNPADNTQCYGYASTRQLALTCPSVPGWGNCLQHFYRSSAATTAASIFAVLAAVAVLALF